MSRTPLTLYAGLCEVELSQKCKIQNVELVLIM